MICRGDRLAYPIRDGIPIMWADEARTFFIVIIPARLASTRLPNKPLADLGGKPMVVRVASPRAASEAAAFEAHIEDQARVVGRGCFGLGQAPDPIFFCCGTSRTADAAHAWEITGSHLGTVTPSSGAHGTTIDVRDLYFNTPARRKFLKSEQTEFGHCADVVRRIALARPDVSFSLAHNGKTVDHWMVGEMAKRSAQILGENFATARLPIDENAGPLRIHGYAGLPTASKARADGQYFYVNGRFVRDKVLMHAVRAAYEDVLHGDRFPSYVLALEEIAAADGGLSTVMSVNNSPDCAALLAYGSPEQKEKWLKPLARGETLGAFCLTEPHAGSDASNLKTRAEKRGNGWVLNGVKQFITSGRTADMALVFAVTDPSSSKRGISCFIVPTDAPGYRVASVEKKVGQKSSDTCQIAFEDCTVGADAML
eukprot:gene40423-49997_t